MGVVETLLDCPAIRAHAPELEERLQAVLARARGGVFHTEKPYEHVKSENAISLFGLPILTKDGQRSRNQVGRRKAKIYEQVAKL